LKGEFGKMADDYSFEGFYNGGVSSFDSSYGKDSDSGVPGTFTGYRMNAYKLGFPGSTQTANQLGEAVNAIKQGVTSFEVTMGIADTAEQIPKQHFEEMRALMKLTGVTPSVHAPFNIDPAGMGGERGTYEEATREENERRFFDTLKKAKLVNPDGNTAVVFHSTGIGTGTEYQPGKEGEERFQAKKIALIDQETGQIATQIKEDTQYNPFEPETLEKGHKLTIKTEDEIKKRINNVNATQWDNQLHTLNAYQKEIGEVIKPFADNMNILETLSGKNKKEIEADENLQRQLSNLNNQSRKVGGFISATQLKFTSAFDNAYKYGTPEQRKELKNLSENLMKANEEIKGGDPYGQQVMFSQILDQGIAGLNTITSGVNPNTGKKDDNFAAPRQLALLEDFTRDKASETFSKLAFKSFTELGKGDATKAPVIAIENMNQMGYAKPSDFKKLVEDSREKFTNMLMTEKNMKKKEAQEVADRLIGVTWDVGHLNMIKKHGFNDDDVIKASKEIAPYLKHVHLTDNFGYADSHLAPGMGNVPLKKIMEELEKSGNLDKVVKIVEAPGFVQHFKKSPHGLTMAALGSPIYSSKANLNSSSVYWNQTSAMSGGGYFGSPLAQFPEKHFSMYGSGFSSLPTEMGGQMPGSGSRFSGTSMA
jgi:sugar phosphate isomerase/epimerase